MIIFYAMMHFDGGTTLKRRTYSLPCLRTKNINKGFRECTKWSTLCVISLLPLLCIAAQNHSANTYKKTLTLGSLAQCS